MSKRDRKKASDVFRESTFVFGDKVPFEEAFPTIEDIEVRVTETGTGLFGESESRILRDKKHIGEFVNCSNSICYNGGVRIGSIINSMVSNLQTEYSKGHICQGYEGSPKGRKKYRNCVNYFKVEIHISYKEKTQDQV